MSVFNPRNRLINFRLSEDEYQTLREASSVHGARSVSDFARTAVLKTAASPPLFEMPTLSDDIHHLNNKVAVLENNVLQLKSLIERLVVDSPHPMHSGAG